MFNFMTFNAQHLSMKMPAVEAFVGALPEKWDAVAVQEVAHGGKDPAEFVMEGGICWLWQGNQESRGQRVCS